MFNQDHEISENILKYNFWNSIIYNLVLRYFFISSILKALDLVEFLK